MVPDDETHVSMAQKGPIFIRASTRICDHGVVLVRDDASEPVALLDKKMGVPERRNTIWHFARDLASRPKESQSELLLSKATWTPPAPRSIGLQLVILPERQRQLEERRNRLNESKGASTVREMLDKAEGPLFTSHPKASHVLGSRVVHAESDPLKDLEDFVADMYREIQEDAMLPGDTPPGERYDPRLRERAQAQLRYPRNTLCRMTFGFDGRRYGEDYLILAKGEQIMWLKEEGGWNFGRKVEPPYQEGWFPPEFARPV
eukprot:symbB.v1.2.019100.t1/scaffold1548.1/size117880/5